MKKTVAAVAGGIALLTLSTLTACAAPTAPESAASGGPWEVRSEFSQELHDALPAEIREKGAISVVGETNQPWRIVAADGSVTGLQSDILAEFSTILGVEFTTEMASGLPAAKLGVQSDRNDVGFGPLLDNEATRKDLLFIDYTLGRPSFLYPADAQKITKVADICGKRLGVLESSAAFDKFLESFDANCRKAGAEPATVVSLADVNALILAVQSNRVDLAGMGAHQAAYAAQGNPDKFQRYISTDAEWPPDQLAMGFDPRDPELAGVMFEAWKKIFENGAYDELMKTYELTEIAVDEPVLRADAANR